MLVVAPLSHSLQRNSCVYEGHECASLDSLRSLLRLPEHALRNSLGILGCISETGYQRIIEYPELGGTNSVQGSKSNSSIVVRVRIGTSACLTQQNLTVGNGQRSCTVSKDTGSSSLGDPGLLKTGANTD